ncbi:MAG TPA: hypothetical protein EYP10_03000, partial [Armatimonadetes bacterium]|nr:hypothetical protein [Armatimonadota bacterium]
MWHHVTWATDFSDASEAALNFVLPLVERFGAKVALVHCVPDVISAYTSGDLLDPLPADLPVVLSRMQAREKESAMERLRAKAEQLRARGISTEVAVIEGDAHHALLEYARENGSDLIAIGTRGIRGWEQWLVGSTTARVMQGATMPVMSVCRVCEPRYESVLVPTDLSKSTIPALSYASAFAQAVGGVVHLLHVMEMLEGLSEREAMEKLEGIVHDRLNGMVQETVGSNVRIVCHVLRRHYAGAGIIEFVEEHEMHLVIMC